jgi:pyridoxamine 5'-phosphate oxidase
MIVFRNSLQEEPYQIFKEKFILAKKSGQSNADAVSISSYNKYNNEVDSRFVNLKLVDGKEFIFFSNYGSPKSIAFESHNQISALFFWPLVNIQIRIKAHISKTAINFNNSYFAQRSLEKNALAISSNQSKPINSFIQIKKKFKKTFENDDLTTCPEYWGGFSFIPYEIEFWEGNEFRLNKRNLYRKDNTTWTHFILEP